MTALQRDDGPLTDEERHRHGLELRAAPVSAENVRGILAGHTTREEDLRASLERLCVAIEIDTGRGFEQSRDVEDALADARRTLT